MRLSQPLPCLLRLYSLRYPHKLETEWRLETADKMWVGCLEHTKFGGCQVWSVIQGQGHLVTQDLPEYDMVK